MDSVHNSSMVDSHKMDADSPASLRVGVGDNLGANGRSSRWVELRRPEKHNCLSLEMLEGLLAAVEQANGSQLILMGAGRSFCSGLDLKELAVQGDSRPHLERLVKLYQQLLTTELRTVALVRGYAAGGGVGLAACARTVIAATDFRCVVPGGSLARWAAVVVPVCKLRTGRGAPEGSEWLGCKLEAPEAHRLGLVDQIVSAGQMDELIEGAKRGDLRLGQFPAKDQDPRAVAEALSELHGFLADWDGQG